MIPDFLCETLLLWLYDLNNKIYPVHKLACDSSHGIACDIYYVPRESQWQFLFVAFEP